MAPFTAVTPDAPSRTVKSGHLSATFVCLTKKFCYIVFGEAGFGTAGVRSEKVLLSNLTLNEYHLR